MRRMIAALQVSLDGFIEGPNGELDWVADWNDDFDIRAHVDTCVLGAGMYPGYERYWTSILADPTGVLEFTGRLPTNGERDYADFADRTPHVVLSTSLRTASWSTTHIVRDVEELRVLKDQPGKDIFVVGGATLVSSLMNLHMIDELRLVVHPLVLGGGKALFKDVTERHPLGLTNVASSASGHVSLTYQTATTGPATD
jgi:dihydrofolate reductase